MSWGWQLKHVLFYGFGACIFFIYIHRYKQEGKKKIIQKLTPILT